MGKPNSGKGQVSAEMIILIAAVLAVALILVMQMQKTADEGSKRLRTNANSVLREINDTLGIATSKEKKDAGESCSKDAECKSGTCNLWDGKCE